MKIIIIAFVLLILLIPFLSKVEAIKGTVIDSETEEPIEGAYVFAEWTKTKGLGLTYTKTYKVTEAITDASGKFNISGVLNPFVNRPTVVVYKKGYTAWNNQYIFPDWEKRKDWKSGVKIRLTRFSPDYTHYGHKYTHYGHMDFLDSPYLLGNEGNKIIKASEWERKLARKEIDTQVQIKWTWKVVDDETGLPIEGAIGLMRGTGLGYSSKIRDIEVISDKEGKLIIEGKLPIVRPPLMTIYKKGHVVWMSGVIFPSDNKRKDFKWQEDYIVRLKKWDTNYSHPLHFYFIQGRAINSKPRVKTKLEDAIAWEEHHGRSK